MQNKMWLIITLSCLLIIIIYLLLAPFFVEIDSTIGLFRIRFHHLANASMKIKESSIFLDLKIAWWKKEFDLLKPKKQKQHKPDELVEQLLEKKYEKQRKHNFRKMWRKGKAVVKSFRVRKCRIVFDTGDMPVNAILYPWLYLLSARTGKTVMISFTGENEIMLQIENSIARMLWAYIRS